MAAPSQPNVHEKHGVPELLSTEIYLFFHCIILGVALAILYVGGRREK